MGLATRPDRARLEIETTEIIQGYSGFSPAVPRPSERGYAGNPGQKAQAGLLPSRMLARSHSHTEYKSTGRHSLGLG